ncbi:hypothetical protein [Nocardia africana]
MTDITRDETPSPSMQAMRFPSCQPSTGIAGREETIPGRGCAAIGGDEVELVAWPAVSRLDTVPARDNQWQGSLAGTGPSGPSIPRLNEELRGHNKPAWAKPARGNPWHTPKHRRKHRPDSV